MTERLSHHRRAVQAFHKKPLYREAQMRIPWAGLWRFADDATPADLHHVARAYSADVEMFVRLPYKLIGNAFLRAFRRVTGEDCALKRGAVIVPVRDSSGSIRGLCDWQGTWISPPIPHVSNPKRAVLGVHLTSTIISADMLAESLNCCAVALNGFDERVIWGLFPRLKEITILSRPREAVAA